MKTDDIMTVGNFANRKREKHIMRYFEKMAILAILCLALALCFRAIANCGEDGKISGEEFAKQIDWMQKQNRMAEDFEENRHSFGHAGRGDRPFMIVPNVVLYKDGYDFDFRIIYPQWTEKQTHHLINETSAEADCRFVMNVMWTFEHSMNYQDGGAKGRIRVEAYKDRVVNGERKLIKIAETRADFAKVQ